MKCVHFVVQKMGILVCNFFGKKYSPPFVCTFFVRRAFHSRFIQLRDSEDIVATIAEHFGRGLFVDTGNQKDMSVSVVADAVAGGGGAATRDVPLKPKHDAG